MSARFIVGDVFDGLATLADGSVDLVVSSPPFLALRSYLPADHPDKGREIGSEPTPAAFLDVMLAVTAELRRVLAPHGSICVELGDTYASNGGGERLQRNDPEHYGSSYASGHNPTVPSAGGEGWPLAKSKTLIPELYRIALAYGINPLTGQASPAGRWRVRNNVTWCRPNPPVGALGDKWRPATSDIVIACTSDKRYWDDIATRKPGEHNPNGNAKHSEIPGQSTKQTIRTTSQSGAPLLDYWEIPPGGYSGSHYAVFPTALVEPLVKSMAPPKVCRTCGEPSRRIVEVDGLNGKDFLAIDGENDRAVGHQGKRPPMPEITRTTIGWSDCGHDNWRPALVLDMFAGSGTTLSVATGHGHDAIGIDLDERNYDLALERIGPLLLDEAVTA